MGKFKDSDREFFDAMVRGLRDTGGKSASVGGISYDSELSSKLRDAYDTISRLEKRNHFLIEIIENLKSTYEFFEQTNDMRILHNNSAAISNF